MLEQDSISIVQYLYFLYHGITGNVFEQVSYYRSFFDRVSTMLKRLTDPKQRMMYREKEFLQLYSAIDGSSEVIRQANKVRQKNPLIHAEGTILETPLYRENLLQSQCDLKNLIGQYLDTLTLSI